MPISTPTIARSVTRRARRFMQRDIRVRFRSLVGSVIIGDLPSVPLNLAVTGFTSNSVTLTWDDSLDDGGSAIFHYPIRFWPTSNPDESQFFSQGLNTSGVVTVTGLLPSTSYSFAIAAQNAVGIGEFTDAVVQETDAGMTIFGYFGQFFGNYFGNYFGGNRT